MAFSHTLTSNWSGGGGTSLTASNAYSAAATYNFTEAILAVPNTEVACVVDVSEIKSIYIICDEDILLEVNDNVGGGGIINLLAGVPYVWYTGSYYVNLFAVDITALFFTNATGRTATVEFRCVVDPTP